jgi:hypothetical protein
LAWQLHFGRGMGELACASIAVLSLLGNGPEVKQEPGAVTAHERARDPSDDASLDQAIQAACDDVRAVWPVPPALVRAVIRRESNFDPRALSPAGAVGLMQVMSFNAPKVGLAVEELAEPRKNVLAGTRLLAVLLKHYEGDLISALSAYNARPRRLFAPLPNNGETPAYVAAVLRFYRAYGGDFEVRAIDATSSEPAGRSLKSRAADARDLGGASNSQSAQLP